MGRFPYQIREKNDQREEAADPDPLSRKRFCSPDSSSPATTAKPNTSIECLFSSPTPAIAPNAIQRSGDAPRTMRNSNQSAHEPDQRLESVH